MNLGRFFRRKVKEKTTTLNAVREELKTQYATELRQLAFRDNERLGAPQIEAVGLAGLLQIRQGVNAEFSRIADAVDEAHGIKIFNMPIAVSAAAQTRALYEAAIKKELAEYKITIGAGVKPDVVAFAV